MPQHPRPELHADNSEDEKDEEAKKEDVAEHGESVQ